MENDAPKKFQWNARTLAVLGVLLAAEIVLSRFLSLSLWNVKIGFSFVPVALAAMLYGPLPAALLGALGDLIGALLFPVGPYFPGFTLTAFFTGLTFGLFLHPRQTVKGTLFSVLIVQFILGLLLNTWWIAILYGKGYLALIPARLLQAVLLTAVQFFTLRALSRLPAYLARQGLI